MADGLLLTVSDSGEDSNSKENVGPAEGLGTGPSEGKIDPPEEGVIDGERLGSDKDISLGACEGTLKIEVVSAVGSAVAKGAAVG